MNIRAVIAEYNPFHFGHAAQLRFAREGLSRDDALLIMMSGDFCQRGIPAVLDKYQRATLALRHGADLVFELPAYYACSYAKNFADGACSLLNDTGLSPEILCGAEHGLPRLLRAAAEILQEEPPHFKAELHKELDKGVSCAEARAKALALTLSETGRWADLLDLNEADREDFLLFSEKASDLAHEIPSGSTSERREKQRRETLCLARDLEEARARWRRESETALDLAEIGARTRYLESVFAGANNILALSYFESVLRRKLDLRIRLLPRVGCSEEKDSFFAAEGDSSLLAPDRGTAQDSCPLSRPRYLSASALREKLKDIPHSPSSVFRTFGTLLPPASLAALAVASQTQTLLFSDQLSLPLTLTWHRTDRKQLETLPEFAEGLLGRLENSYKKLPSDLPLCSQFEALVGEAACKRYPQTRIRRALLHLILGAEHFRPLPEDERPRYLRVLAMNRRGQYLLRQMQKTTRLPLLMNVSDGLQLQDEKQRRAFNLDLSAELFAAALRGQGKGSVYQRHALRLRT